MHFLNMHWVWCEWENSFQKYLMFLFLWKHMILRRNDSRNNEIKLMALWIVRSQSYISQSVPHYNSYYFISYLEQTFAEDAWNIAEISFASTIIQLFLADVNRLLVSVTSLTIEVPVAAYYERLRCIVAKEKILKKIPQRYPKVNWDIKTS